MIITARQSGFTLIEMLVSLSLFTVIITITVGSLLVLINGNRDLVNSQTVMDSLAFSLDSMTREIRTGRAYFCASVNNQNAAFPGNGLQIFRDTSNDHESINNDVNDCANGRQGRNFHGVSIIEGGDSITGATDRRILYYFDAEASPGRLMRRVGNNPAEPILSSSIDVIDANFFVTGTDSLTDSSNDIEQPTVTIFLQASDINNPSDFITLQTTITQRELDI